jgi:intracellular sulfur oxidation DsrE/DsrF family protein
MSEQSESPFARRFFLTRVSTGMTVLGAAVAGGIPSAAGQTSPASQGARWQAERHTQDDWLDQIPGKHRLVFDTTESGGMGSALQYATNYYAANNSGYGLQNGDLAVVIVARHISTPYAYKEEIWAKYGVPIAGFAESGKEPTMRNAHARQITGLLGRGMHLAVCQLATRRIAGSIASAVNGNTDEIYNELAANLMPNSHMAPAGIVAVARAQERGYALVHAV